MSRHRFRRLEKYRTGGDGDSLELSLPVPLSATGKVMRRCPSEECTPGLFMLGPAPDFRVVASDNFCASGRSPGSDPWNCPYCGHVEALTAFMTDEDAQALFEFVGALAVQDMRDAVAEQLKQAFEGASSSGRDSGITFKAAVSPPSTEPRLPVRHDLLRNLRCDSCGCGYGVFAIGLFCPDCGAPNLSVHFAREVELIELQIALAGDLEDEFGEEAAYRMLGNSHEDTLTAFEAYQKTVYRFYERRLGLEPKRASNAFQNVDRAMSLFRRVRLEPYAVLDESEVGVLRRHIQKRHVIGHNLGQVDERFEGLEEGLHEGELVPVLSADVVAFAALCARVVAELNRGLAGAPGFTAVSER